MGWNGVRGGGSRGKEVENRIVKYWADGIQRMGIFQCRQEQQTR